MKRIPTWKAKREVVRIGSQIRELPGFVWEYAALRLRYDWQAARLRRTHDGDVPLGREVAIYLIFPAGGLLGSHLSMLRTLKAQDIAPVLVSNLPLSGESLATLRPLCARIIERPNVGYDFGGYRDGVLDLADRLSRLDRLYILNDSTWMVDAPRTWFEDVRDRDVDFCGATSNYGVKRYNAHNFREMVWDFSDRHPNFHYASYALSVGRRILRDPDFLSFWRRFRLSNHKKRTVRRGEIGLTQWVLAKGYSHAATCPDAGLDAEIAALDDDALEALARNLVIPENSRLSALRDEILAANAATPGGRLDRIQIVLTAISAQAVAYALPFHTIRNRGFQFIKKTPLWLSPDSREKTLNILSGLEGPLGREAYKEAVDLLKKRQISMR